MSASEQAVLNSQWNAAQFACEAEVARSQPHVLMRPSLSVEGNQWCALYGQNLQDGVCGFGDTPVAAMDAFDMNWRNQRIGESS